MQLWLDPRLTPFCRRPKNKIYSKSELRYNHHAETRGNHTVLVGDGIDPISFNYGQREALQCQRERKDLSVSTT